MIEIFQSLPQYINPSERLHTLKNKPWGIILLNMGGPETLDQIQPYLYNLFRDNNIIKLPLSFILQKPLAKFISVRRAKKVREKYKLIGGGSPQLQWTKKTANGLADRLHSDYPRVHTYVGMRYSSPFISDALQKAEKDRCKHVVILPLYPQYTLATTGTSLETIIKQFQKNGFHFGVSLIPFWHTHPDYIALLRRNIQKALDKLPNREKFALVFSAHSLPEKYLQNGDPYKKQIEETSRLAGNGYEYILSYQSQTGPVKWLGPKTIDKIIELGERGIKNVVLVPISFVSDHIETLHEIDIEFKEIAHRHGIRNFIRTESFNDNPRFIALLEKLIREHLESKPEECL